MGECVGLLTISTDLLVLSVSLSTVFYVVDAIIGISPQVVIRYAVIAGFSSRVVIVTERYVFVARTRSLMVTLVTIFALVTLSVVVIAVRTVFVALSDSRVVISLAVTTSLVLRYSECGFAIDTKVVVR